MNQTRDNKLYRSRHRLKTRTLVLVIALAVLWIAGVPSTASTGQAVASLRVSEPLEAVVAKLEKLEQIAGELGTKLPSPFSTLSFLALPVIPELRLTDLGLVDVNQFKLVRRE